MRYLNAPKLFAVAMTLAFVAYALCMLTGCTSGVPRQTKVNGHTVVQTERKFLGMPVHTKTEVVKTKAQQLDDLAVQKETREQELDLQTEERQSAAAFWFGLIMFALAAGCVVAGYVLRGWKFWGGLAAIAGGLGGAAWAFEHLVPLLKYGAYGMAGCVVLWTMYKLKDFDLLDRIKHSEPGELLGNKSRSASDAPELGGTPDE